MALAASTPKAVSSPRFATLAAHAAFVPIGFVTVLLGPLLPLLRERWALSYTQAGYLFTAQFTGATLGVSLSGLLIRHYGYRASMVLGLSMMTIAVAIFPLLGFGSGLVAIAGYGAAIGLMGPTCNCFVAELNPRMRAAALNWLNFSWGVGAVSCPFLVAAAARFHQMHLLFYAIAAIGVLVGLSIPFLVPATLDAPRRTVARNCRQTNFWTRPELLVLCSVFFLYVGTENSITGWVAAYGKETDSASQLPLVTSSFFLLALLAGRFAAPFSLKLISEMPLARAGLGIAVAGTLALLFSHTLSQIMVSASIAGLGLSSVFPITIAFLSQSFGKESPRAGSIAFNMANVGGATMPWLVGYCSSQFSSLSAGLAVPFAAAAIMLLIFSVPVTSRTLFPEEPCVG